MKRFLTASALTTASLPAAGEYPMKPVRRSKAVKAGDVNPE